MRKKCRDKAMEFVSVTITLPAEVVEFGRLRARSPQYAGNFSGYVRSLVLADREQIKDEAAVPQAA